MTMAAALGRAVQGVWGGDRADGPAPRWLGPLLAPAEQAFRCGVFARNAWHDRRRPVAAPMPVVSVGNLVVGGVGKTPVVRWMADWLAEAGIRAAVVSRGYGDEAALHRRWAGADAVFTGRDRCAAVSHAWARGHRIALLDDGFQHRILARDIDVVLVAAEDSMRARMLPRGPYREPLRAVRRATHVLVTCRTAGAGAARAWRDLLARLAPGVPSAAVRMEMGPWTDLAGGPADAPAGEVMAVCSIARPAAFASGLRTLLGGARLELVAFPDHHDFTAADVATLRKRRAGRALACTEKDAVKLAQWRDDLPGARAVGLRVAGPLPTALADALAHAVGRRRAEPGPRPAAGAQAGAGCVSA